MASGERLWYGRNRAVSGQLVLIAVGLFALTMAVFYTDVNTLWPAPLAPSGCLFLIMLAGIVAYNNEGLLVVWLLTAVTTLPAFIFYPPRGPVYAISPATSPSAFGKAGQ